MQNFSKYRKIFKHFFKILSISKYFLLISLPFLQVDVEYKSLNDYQKLCLQPFAKREFVEQLLKYKNKKELYNSLKSWTIPKFPVNGNQLKERGCPSQKKMGLIMNQLKLIWAESDFKLTSEELLDKHLPQILEDLKSPTLSPNKKLKTSK